MSPSLPKSPSAADLDLLANEKVIRTFRMPRGLLDLLGMEANQYGLDMTALVLRALQGYLTHFGLPAAAVAELEADREALNMDRSQYLAHLLYYRSLAVREFGSGFDDPRIPQRVPTQPEPELAAEHAAKTRTPGAAGGGTNRAIPGLVPGAGVWPWGAALKRR